jgi:catechol 2,3-dioxygenase-like lactoylglutathione lyase family enzyme
LFDADGEDRVMIKGLHHNAYRCRDSEETRRFYEDFLGLPLADAFEIKESKTGRETSVLHSFYRLGDGSFLAFFEVPGSPFEFKAQHDYDLHIALEVDAVTLRSMFEKGKAAGVETRGVADHGFIHSIYFRDPNGYVIELTAPTDGAAGYAVEAEARAHDALASWQDTKPRA